MTDKTKSANVEAEKKSKKQHGIDNDDLEGRAGDYRNQREIKGEHVRDKERSTAKSSK